MEEMPDDPSGDDDERPSTRYSTVAPRGDAGVPPVPAMPLPAHAVEEAPTAPVYRDFSIPPSSRRASTLPPPRPPMVAPPAPELSEPPAGPGPERERAEASPPLVERRRAEAPPSPVEELSEESPRPVAARSRTDVPPPPPAERQPAPLPSTPSSGPPVDLEFAPVDDPSSAPPPSSAVVAQGPAPGPAAEPLPALDTDTSNEERRQREALADFTRQLVQTFNRTSYYQAGHPAAFHVRDELYDGLASVIVGQPQIGYLLERGRVPQVLIDGLGQTRKKLSDIMSEGVYDIFVPRFIEYFDRHDLVLLAFRQGITLDEFGQFVAVMSRPAPTGDDKVELSQLLLDAGVLHVSTLGSRELGFGEGSLPWQVRVCLARLRRDLRTIPYFRDRTVEELRRAKQQIFADVVRPIQLTDELTLLVRHAPRIQRELADVEEVRDLPVVDWIVHVLAPRRLVELTRALVLAWETARAARAPDADELRHAIETCAARLMAEPIAERDPVLRVLHDHGVVPFEGLPADLRDWLLAERHIAARASGEAVALPSATPHDLRVLVKIGRLHLVAGRIDDAVEVIDHLRERAAPDDDALADAARGALAAIVSDEEAEELVEKLERSTTLDAERFGRILRSLGEVGARALVARTIASGEKAKFGTVWHLLDTMPDAMTPALAEAIGRHDLHPQALRVLLALATRHGHPRLAHAAVAHVRHREMPVRREAVMAAVAAASVEGLAVVRHAAADPAPEIVAIALAALADRYQALDEACSRALSIAEGAQPAPQIGADLLDVALRLLSRAPEGERPRAVAAIRHVLEVEQRPTGFLGITNRPVERPEVVKAAQAALEALGESIAAPRKSFFDFLRKG